MQYPSTNIICPNCHKTYSKEDVQDRPLMCNKCINKRVIQDCDRIMLGVSILVILYVVIQIGQLIFS